MHGLESQLENPCHLSKLISTHQESGYGHKESTIKAWKEAGKEPHGPHCASFRLRLCSAALPLTDMWHSRLHGHRSQALDGYRHWKMSCLNMLRLDLLPHILSASCPSVYFNYTRKLSSVERLPAVSHKPLIVLWSWIVAFYHPATLKGTFATGVSHGIFSGNANRFQRPSFFIPDICGLGVHRKIPIFMSYHIFSDSPYNSLQFFNWFLILMNTNGLIQNHLFLVNPQKHLKQNWFL